MKFREVEFEVERTEKWVPVGCNSSCMFMDSLGEIHRCPHLVDVIPMSIRANLTVRCSKDTGEGGDTCEE